MNNDWLSEKITYISALKNPSDAQKLLLELAKIQYRTPEQEKKLNAFIKAKNAKYDVSQHLLASVYERYTEKSRLDSLKNNFKT